MKKNSDSELSLVLVIVTPTRTDESKLNDSKIQSRASTSAYASGWDNVFGTKKDTVLN